MTPLWPRAALVAALAIAVRLLHAAFLSSTPFFEGQVIDAATYRQLAERIAATGDYGGAFYQPPLYPAFLAVLIRIGLGSTWAIAIVQSLLGGITAAMLVPIGERLSGSDDATIRGRTGLVTGIVAALYGPLVLFDLELLPPAVIHPLLVGALWIGLRARPKIDVLDGLGGLLTGVAATGWGPGAILGAGALAMRALALPTPRARAALALLWLVAAAPPLYLTASHNARNGGEGVLVSFNAGINFWLGNNPRWRDTWRARPGAAFEPELERPDREGVTQPGERSKYFVRLAMRDIEERPGAALARTAEKLYYAWHGREIRRNQDIEILRDASPLLRALQWEAGLLFPFGLVAPLALVGIFRRRRERIVVALALAVLAYSLVMALFFVASRYRLPMALFLLPLAADEATWLATAGRRHRPTWAALAAAIVALSFPVHFTTTFAAGATERAILEAHARRNQGDAEGSARIARDVAASAPDDANAQMLLAEMQIAEGDCRAASVTLERVIALAPRASTPWVRLGHCREDLGDLPGAERAYAAAISLHPHHPIGLRSAAEMYARHGRVIEARSLLRRFVASGYDDPGVERMLRELESIP